MNNMENKDDWKELEQWAENEKKNKIDNYKIDIGNSEEMKEKKRKVRQSI